MSTPEHKYTVGQVVQYASGFTLPQERTNVTILMQLPPLGTILQYRVRNEKETHDRIVLETALE
jgi:hypothetical protein